MGWILFYSALLAGAEASFAAGYPVASLLLHALLLFGLLNHYALCRSKPGCEPLLALAILPLARMASVVMPIQRLPPLYVYGLTGLPVLLAIWSVVRYFQLSWAALGFTRGSLWQQGLIAVTGLPASWFLVWWLDPPVGVWERVSVQWPNVAIGVLMVTLFVGLTEEVIFHGLIQRPLTATYGPAGVAISSVLFAIMYLNMGSWRYLLFMAGLGLIWGWFVYRTDRLWGVVIAHSLFQCSLIYLWPALL